LRSHRPYLLSVGIVGILWAGSQGFAAVVKALSRIYCARETRNWIRQRALSLVMMITVGMASLLVLVLMTGLDPGGPLSGIISLPAPLLALWSALRWPFLFLAQSVVMARLYTTVPCVRQRARWITPGGLVASLIWLATCAALPLYVDRSESYSRLYGSIGDVVVLMLWLYIGAFALLFGAEIKHRHHARRRAPGRAGDVAQGRHDGPRRLSVSCARRAAVPADRGPCNACSDLYRLQPRPRFYDPAVPSSNDPRSAAPVGCSIRDRNLTCGAAACRMQGPPACFMTSPLNRGAARGGIGGHHRVDTRYRHLRVAPERAAGDRGADEGRLRGDDISLSCPKHAGREFGIRKAPRRPRPRRPGATIGACWARIAGGLVAVGSLAVPGLSLVAADRWWAPLTGLGVGGATGGVTGALVGSGSRARSQVLRRGSRAGRPAGGVYAHGDRSRSRARSSTLPARSASRSQEPDARRPARRPGPRGRGGGSDVPAVR